ACIVVKMSEILAKYEAPSESQRGIPLMEVIGDVAEYLKKEGDDNIQDAIARLTEAYKKYKYVESNLATQKERMLGKLPEYDDNLAMIRLLIEKRTKGESLETHYLVSEEAWTKAKVEKPEKVSVWLGANVMVEYDLDEAKALFEKNRDSVQKAVDELSRELLFVKDQTTTAEVNLAHLHNHQVRTRAGAPGAK
ncbi:hypothetical protein PFISCL1PPCAC_16368, partial [Pristionchus fissidentatus]